MTRSKLANAFLAALTLILLLAAWTSFAPLQFGGQASYVVVAGASMEPSLQRGDLVVARQSSNYQVGDIVTYLHPRVGPVIHRVIAKEGVRFVVKGDNNDWVDTYQPEASEVIGKAWLHVPNAGQFISRLRQPGWMALISILLGLMIMTTILKDKEQKTRWLSQDLLPWENWEGWLDTLAKHFETLFFTLSAVGLLSLMLAALAFSKPTLVRVLEEIPYEHRGSFEYSAYVPRGIYNSNQIQAGEPVFLELTERVRVQFDYQLLGEDLTAVGGSQRLIAEIRDINGWKRTLEIGPESPFSGSTFSSQGYLDLGSIQSVIADLEDVTGLTRPHYTLSVYPTIEVSGSLSGTEFSDRYAPRLEFLLDEVQLQLVRSDSPLEDSDPLAHAAAGILERLVMKPNTLSILGLEFEVADVRWISGAGLLLALIGGIGLAYLAKRVRYQGAPAEIQLKLRDRLITIKDGMLDKRLQVMQVASIADLAKLADQADQMILHEVRGSVHHYYLSQGEMTYHFVAREPVDGLERTDKDPSAEEAGDPA